MKQVLTAEQIATMSVDEINKVIIDEFQYDEYKYQKENGIKITESYIAEGLHKILYQCPHCKAESKMASEGAELWCTECGKRWYMNEDCSLTAKDGETEFSHIPDWFDWERECVRRDLEEGKYELETDVEIAMLVDHKRIYVVGDGHLSHTKEGFHLTGCDGKLEYIQKPQASYSINSDYYFYERGDIISIGSRDGIYYCFPKDNTPVAKAKLAAEELFKLTAPESRKKQ